MIYPCYNTHYLSKLVCKMNTLPSKIKALILFNYLDFPNIGNCYLAGNIFHCLNEKQLTILKYAKNGWMNNIKNGHLNTCKWLYNSGIETGKPIDIHADEETVFSESCFYGHIETSKWLYNLGIETGKPIDIHALWSKATQFPSKQKEKAFIWSCISGHIETSKWLYKLCINMGSPIDLYVDRGWFHMKDVPDNGEIEMYKWLKKKIRAIP